jgi:hypothetical protein
MAILVSNRNVTIECSNGLAVSLAYGDGSYSSNRDGTAPRTATGAVECATVEVAILDLTKTGEDHYVKLRCDSEGASGIHGYVTADEVGSVVGAIVAGDLEQANKVLNHWEDN